MVIFLEIRYFKQSQSNFFNISILFQCKLCKVHTSHTLFTGLMVHRWSISATYMSLRHTCLSDTHVSRTHMSLGHIRPTWPNKVNRKDLPSMNVGISPYYFFWISRFSDLQFSDVYYDWGNYETRVDSNWTFRPKCWVNKSFHLSTLQQKLSYKEIFTVSE